MCNYITGMEENDAKTEKKNAMLTAKAKINLFYWPVSP